MQNNFDRTFKIAPHLNQKDSQKFWAFSLVVLIGQLSLAFVMGNSEFQAYAISAVVLFILIYFQSLKSRSLVEARDWPCIMLSDRGLQIRQVGSLLWSKKFEDVSSAEVEDKQLLFFSSKALLIKCSDNDSYYLNVPKPYSEEESIESIAQEINQRVRSYSELRNSKQ